MKKEKQKNTNEASAAAGGAVGAAGDKKGQNFNLVYQHFVLKSSLPEGLKELSPLPEYIDARIQLWDKLKAQYLEELSQKPKDKINVTLPDGKVVEGLSWQSTPYDIACGISKGLADNTVIARVNKELWDLDRPLEGDCTLQLLKFDDPEAQAVFWHSSAHVLGEVMEKVRSAIELFPIADCY